MKHLKKFISWIKKIVKRFFHWILFTKPSFKIESNITKERLEEKLKAIRDGWPDKAREFYEIYLIAREIYFSKFTYEEKNNWFVVTGNTWQTILGILNRKGFVLEYEKNQDYEKNVYNFMSAMQKKADLVCHEDKSKTKKVKL